VSPTGVSSPRDFSVYVLTCELIHPFSLLQLHLPLTTPLPGSELTKEPFRWDQRLFSLVLRIPGHSSPDPEPLGGVPLDSSPITPMCEVTGGVYAFLPILVKILSQKDKGVE